MANDIETKVQNDLATILQTLTLTGIDIANIGIIREAPKETEVIDTMPAVLICPRGPNKSTPLGWDGPISRTYTEEIIIIAGREGDFATYQAQAQQWKEQCVEIIDRTSPTDFRTKLTTATTVYAVEVSDIASVDRTKLDSSYAYTQFFVVTRSSE